MFLRWSMIVCGELKLGCRNSLFPFQIALKAVLSLRSKFMGFLKWACKVDPICCSHPNFTLFLLARPFLGTSPSSPDGFRIRIVLESPRFAMKICVGVIIDAVQVDPLYVNRKCSFFSSRSSSIKAFLKMKHN